MDYKSIAESCCLFGHHLMKDEDKADIYNFTMDFIIKLYNKGYRHFFAAEVLGYSRVAITAVLNAKIHYPDITLTLFLHWERNSTCDSMIKHCQSSQIPVPDEVIYIIPPHAHNERQRKMRFLIDTSSASIVYQTNKQGLAAYGVKYARANEKRIYNIAVELSEK